MSHRCIDGGAGVDGCSKREFFEVLGRDPTWRLAVQADVGWVSSLRDSLAVDSLSHGYGAESPELAHQCDVESLQGGAPRALPAPPPFEVSDLLTRIVHEFFGEVGR